MNQPNPSTPPTSPVEAARALTPEERLEDLRFRVCGSLNWAYDPTASPYEVAVRGLHELVSQRDRAKIDAAAAERRGAERERERCAKVAEGEGRINRVLDPSCIAHDTAVTIAAAIRARTEKGRR